MRSLSKADRQSLRLEACDLAAAYHEQRGNAPQRAQGYFSSSRSGVTSSSGASKRIEEHLAAGLFLKGELVLPDGAQLTLLDYQFPLKSVQADSGIGKIDLLGLFEDGTLAVVELKVARNREDRRIALMEGLIYAAIVEANIKQIAAEVLVLKGRRVLQPRPRILLIAPAGYWAESRLHPSTTDFEMLTNEVAHAIPLQISLLCLNDANLISLGLDGQAPRVDGRAFLTRVSDDIGRQVPVPRVSRTERGDCLFGRDDDSTG